MQVAHSGAVRSYAPGVLGGTRKADTGRDFSALLWSAAAQSAEKATPERGKSPSPSELYEQMTMTKSPVEEPKRSSATVKGLAWTDDILAGFAGRWAGAEVNTTKSINWNSTGDATLTEEQARELGEKYDLNNLSPQDYYDLMADLTNMNVLGAEDIHSMHVKTLPPGVALGKIIATNGSSAAPASFASGDIMEAVKQALQEALEETEDMLADDFWKRNPEISQEKHGEHLDYLGKRTATMNKLQAVFNQISGAL